MKSVTSMLTILLVGMAIGGAAAANDVFPVRKHKHPSHEVDSNDVGAVDDGYRGKRIESQRREVNSNNAGAAEDHIIFPYGGYSYWRPENSGNLNGNWNGPSPRIFNNHGQVQASGASTSDSVDVKVGGDGALGESNDGNAGATVTGTILAQNGGGSWNGNGNGNGPPSPRIFNNQGHSTISTSIVDDGTVGNSLSDAATAGADSDGVTMTSGSTAIPGSGGSINANGNWNGNVNGPSPRIFGSQGQGFGNFNLGGSAGASGSVSVPNNGGSFNVDGSDTWNANGPTPRIFHTGGRISLGLGRREIGLDVGENLREGESIMEARDSQHGKIHKAK